jgi:hypothetical protein
MGTGKERGSLASSILEHSINEFRQEYFVVPKTEVRFGYDT